MTIECINFLAPSGNLQLALGHALFECFNFLLDLNISGADLQLIVLLEIALLKDGHGVHNLPSVILKGYYGSGDHQGSVASPRLVLSGGLIAPEHMENAALLEGILASLEFSGPQAFAAFGGSPFARERDAGPGAR